MAVIKYVCCKQTQTVLNDLEKLSQETDVVIGVSDPRYNQSQAFKDAMVKKAQFFNVEVFSIEDNENAIRLMTNPTFVAAIKKLGLMEPKVYKDPIVLDKLINPTESLSKLIDFLKLKGFSTHAENLELFQENMRRIPTEIVTPSQLTAWQRGFKCFTKSFEACLHWDKILGCFGPSDITTTQLFELGFHPDLKKVQGTVSWLAKGFNLVKVDGSAADVLNVSRFMFSTTKYSESHIYDMVDYLIKNNFELPEGATIPNSILMDGEWDDDWSLALLCLVRPFKQVRTTPFSPIQRLEVQWPGDFKDKANELGYTLELLETILQQNLVRYHRLHSIGVVKIFNFFWDKESGNVNKVIRN